MREVQIPGAVLKRAIAIALEEMSAGMTAGHRVGAFKGLRPDGNPVLVKGLVVALVPNEDVEAEAFKGIRLAAVNGERL